MSFGGLSNVITTLGQVRHFTVRLKAQVSVTPPYPRLRVSGPPLPTPSGPLTTTVEPNPITPAPPLLPYPTRENLLPI